MRRRVLSIPGQQRARRPDLILVPGRSTSRWVAIIVFVSLIDSISGKAIGQDPLDWQPPTAKAQFRKLLSDADYRRRSASMAIGLQRAMKEAASKLPDHGLKISGVFAPGELKARGITMNDVITQVDGEELWGRHGESSDDPIRVRVYSARQDAFRELKVATDLGHACSIYRRPDLVYLRSQRRNAAWDADTFVGLVASSTDPDLAETAWQHALAAGSPRDRLCLASGAQMAMAQGRPLVALDFWYEAEHNRESAPLDPLLGYRVMIANYKLERARELARTHPKLLPNVADGLETLVALHRARSPQERAAAAPSVQARGMHRRDARADLIGLSPLAENPFLALLTSRDAFHTDPATDHFTLLDLLVPQGLGDFELGLAMTMAPADNRRGDFVKLARLIVSGIRKTDGRDRAEAELIGQVELEVPSGFSLRHCEPGDDVTFPDPMVASDGKGRNAVRFVRVGGQIEAFVNERRILYQPIPAELMLQSIRFQVVGTSVNVTELTLDELIPRL